MHYADVQDVYQQFITNGRSDTTDQSTLERIKTLNVVGSVFILLALCWFLISFTYADTVSTIIKGAGFFVGATFLIVQRKFQNVELITNIAVALLTIILFSLILPTGADSNGIVWIYLLPTFAFFLTGSVGGIIWTAVTMIGLIALVGAQAYGVYPLPMRSGFPINFLLSYSVVAFFSYQYERARAQAEDTLYEKNAELQQLIYTVSHDLKTPVVSLLGYLSFIKEEIATGQDQQRDEDLQKMTVICENMREMINDLLNLSRTRREGTYAHVPISDVIEKILSENESQLRAAGIQTELQGTLPILYTDERKVEEVFRNLISNAIKYMGDKAERKIIIGADKQDGMYKFFVQDTGIGIPSSEVEHVFDPFYAKTNTTASSSGIGLSIAKGFVNSLQGTIGVDSTRDEGSTFWFTLPASFSIDADLKLDDRPNT